MTIDAAFAALVEANPIPDAEAYAEFRLTSAAFLTATRERTTDMQTIDQQESTQKNTQRRWQPLAAVAAFILVIAIGVAATLAMRGGTDDIANIPAPPFETPQQAVEAYNAAMNVGDGETYISLFAEDASDGILNWAGIASDATIIGRVESLAAMDIVYSVVECVPESDSRAKCVVMANDPAAGIITGIGEWEHSIILTIDTSGLIGRLGMNVPPQGTVDVARSDAYDAWMVQNYQELRDEFNLGVWGSDPIDRPAAEIGREFLDAAREFDAQYEG